SARRRRVRVDGVAGFARVRTLSTRPARRRTQRCSVSACMVREIPSDRLAIKRASPELSVATSDRRADFPRAANSSAGAAYSALDKGLDIIDLRRPAALVHLHRFGHSVGGDGVEAALADGEAGAGGGRLEPELDERRGLGG